MRISLWTMIAGALAVASGLQAAGVPVMETLGPIIADAMVWFIGGLLEAFWGFLSWAFGGLMDSLREYLWEQVKPY